MNAWERNALFLLPFVNAVKERSVDVHGIVVHRHQALIGRCHFKNLYRENVYSCAKSVVSLAFGIAAGEGLLSLDDRVSDVLAEWVPEDPSPMLSELTMRSLLTMSAGFRRDPLPHRHSDSFSEDWAGICLGAPFEKRPGTSFYYQNAPTYLISRSIEKRAGETLLKYLKPRLFDPLGIPNPQWFECPNGHTSAFSGLFLTPEEMADIGELCLQNGSWRGKQLVPEEYMKEATSFQIDNRENRLTHEKDDTSGYGYFFWIGSEPGLSYASGVYGQQIYVFRDLDAVISVTADIEEGDANQILLDLIREHLIPHLPE